MARMPVAGTPEQPRLALYYHGMLVGLSSAAYLSLKPEAAVHLLFDSVDINDRPDWIGHLIIWALFNLTIRHDYRTGPGHSDIWSRGV